MRGARADMFGFASRGKIFQLHQKLPSWQPKTGQVLIPHPPAPWRVRISAISVVDAGYVRRSGAASLVATPVGEKSHQHRSPVDAVVISSNGPISLKAWK